MALVSLGEHNLGNIYSRTWNLGVFKGKISEIMIGKNLKAVAQRAPQLLSFLLIKWRFQHSFHIT